MPNSNVYHVVPADERWGVRLEGSPVMSFEADEREDAVERASGYVRQLGAGRVVVHDASGQIEAVHTVDRLPDAPTSWAEAAWSHPVWLALGAAALAALVVGLSRRS